MRQFFETHAYDVKLATVSRVLPSHLNILNECKSMEDEA
jgi:hypothetical protein